jgi:hypothetical protein
MRISNYKFNTFLMSILNFTFVKIPRFLNILRLLSLIYFFFFIWTSIFALIRILWSSRLATISHDLVGKLMDYD